MPREEELVLAYLALEAGRLAAEPFDRALRKAAALEKKGHQASLLSILVDDGLIASAHIEALEARRRETGRKRVVEGYEIEAILGHGGMGCVYRARQISMDRPVALKILPPSWGEDSEWVGRFLREARATARLASPYIVQGYDVGESNGVHYFAMEYVEGQDLRRILEEKGSLPEPEASAIALHVARALECAWEAGIVHRDVKPDNILVTSKGVAKLADLGLARTKEGGSDLTQTGAIIGTPRYISPEQATGSPVDGRSDIYSLGIAFFQALTGRIPFLHESAAVLLARRLTEEVPDPREYRSELSEEVCHIVRRMTRREIRERYQDPTELASDLEAHVQRRPTPPGRKVAPAPPPATEERKPRLSRPAVRASRFIPFHVPNEEETFFALIALKSDVVGAPDVRMALDVQETEAEVGLHRPLDQILVDKGVLSEKVRDRIRAVQEKHRMDELDVLFGRIAVDLGLATGTAVEAGRREQERRAARGEAVRLGEILVDKGLLSPEGKGRVLAEQIKARRTEETRRFGSIALKCGFLDKGRLEQALKVQGQRLKDRTSPSRLGEILVELGFLSDDEARVILRAQRRNELTNRPIRELVTEILKDPGDLEYDSRIADGMTQIVPPPEPP